MDLEPEQFVAEGIAREFRKLGGIENLRILLARAEKARDGSGQETEGKVQASHRRGERRRASKCLKIVGRDA